jgi:4-diphosphocytidyl-2C-methyl-D-erythritol kinase
MYNKTKIDLHIKVTNTLPNSYYDLMTLFYKINSKIKFVVLIFLNMSKTGQIM